VSLTVTMQLNQSRLLDLFARNFVVQRLQIFCRICARFTPRFAQKSTSQMLPSQLHGYGLRSFREIQANQAVFVAQVESFI
jgi:hypothetical protein